MSDRERSELFFSPDGERSGRACVHGPVLGVGPDSGRGGDGGGADRGLAPWSLNLH